MFFRNAAITILKENRGNGPEWVGTSRTQHQLLQEQNAVHPCRRKGNVPYVDLDYGVCSIAYDMKLLFYSASIQEFPHPEDTCYLAHCFPYPYSRLVSYISELERCPQRSRYVSRDTLCYTLAGNCCSVLTITDFDSTSH